MSRAPMIDKDVFPSPRSEARKASRAGDLRSALALLQQARIEEPKDADAILEIAEGWRARGDFAAAESTLVELLRAFPAAIEWLKTLGRIALASNDAELSAACWRLVAKFQPNDRWAGHNLGLSLLRCGRVEDARAAFETVVAACPDFAPSWRGLGQAEASQGRREPALAHFEKAAAQAPEHLPTLLDCLTLCVALGRLDAGRGYCARAQRLAPDDARLAKLDSELAASERRAQPPLTDAAEAFILAAKAALDTGERKTAFEALARAVALRPDDLWLRNDLGHLAVDLGRLDYAEAQFAYVLSRDPGFFHGLRGRARIAKASGAQELALRHYAAALEVSPGDIWMRWEIASLQSETGRLAEASSSFQALLADKPDFAAAHSGLARALRARGDGEGAFAALAVGRRKAPHDPWLALAFAEALVERRELAQAEALLQPLAQGGPAAAAAALALHYLRRNLGEDVAAAEPLSAGLRVAPDDPALLLAAAARAQEEQRLEEAAMIYARLERAQQATYWRLMGQAALARRENRNEIARNLLLDAVAAEPDADPAYAELCALTDDATDTARVLEKLDAWIARKHDDPAPRLRKAAFLATLGDHATALAELSGVLERWPDSVGALVLAAKAQERLGRPQEADTLLKTAERHAPIDPALLELLARRAEARDELGEARRLLDLAIDAAPSQRWLRIAATRVRFLAGAFAQAFAEIETLRARCGADPEIDHLEIEMLVGIGRLEEASVSVSKACARHPHHLRLLARKATLDADLGRFDEAARTLSGAAPANNRERGTLAFLEGYRLMAQWRFDLARPLLRTAWRLNPDDGWFLNRLVHCDLMLFDVEAAGQHLRALAGLNFSLNRLRGRSASFSQTHYGQIYDEFRLDAEALAAVRRALDEPDPAQRLAALRAALRRFPDYTPAAMAFLVACRQSGLLSRPPGAAHSPAPKQIVQFWDEAEIPADLTPYADSWRRQNPDYAYDRFDAARACALIAQGATPDLLGAYERAEQPAMQADIFRLAYLVEHGGVYADVDDCCRSPLSVSLSGGAALTLYQEDLGTVGNNFIAATPRHPVLQRALGDAATTVRAGACDLLWLSTGPGALTRAVCAYVAEDEAGWRERLAQIHILDRPEMLRHVSIHCLSGYKSTSRHWSRTAFGRPPKAKTNGQRPSS